MIPENVRIVSGSEDSIHRERDEDYADYHKRLSSTDQCIQIWKDQQRLFDIKVPVGIFNPYGGVAAQLFVSGICNGQIDVSGKSIVDLGCGCGIIGLAAINAGCRSVLFTDISHNIQSIMEHVLFRPNQDRVAIQDLCINEPRNTYDRVFFSIPSTLVEHMPEHDTYETGIFRDDSLVERAFSEVSRILVDRGEFYFFYRVKDEHFLEWMELVRRLGDKFDLNTLRILWHKRESKAHALLACIEK